MRRTIGLWDAVAIGIGGMIGGGIFSVLGLAAEYAGAATPFAFVVGGIPALLTAYSFAKLTLRYPSRGGPVEFLAKAYKNGLFVGSVNIVLLIGYIVMIALYAYAFGAYASVALGQHSALVRNLIGTVVILFFALLNLAGAKAVGSTEKIIVGLKVLFLGIFIFVGIWSVRPELAFDYRDVDPLGALAAAFLIFLAYEGFGLISNTAEEIENPLVNIPKAFFYSVGIVMAIYVLIAFVTVGHLTPEQIVTARDYALAEAVKPFLGKLGFALVVFAALLSTASAINATIYGSARIAYSLAKHGEIPRFMEMNTWNELSEGLLIVTVGSLLVLNLLGLQGISILGSAIFLFVYGLVNVAAYLLGREALVDRRAAGLGALLCFLSFGYLLIYMSQHSPGSVSLLFLIIIGAFVAEATWRASSGRKIRLRFWEE